QRDVLTSGVDDRLDGGIGEDRGQRRAVEILGQRVDDLDPLGPARPGRDRELDQAQQRSVTALAHELGVKRDPPALLGGGRECAQLLRADQRGVPAHGFAPGSSHSTPARLRPACRETSVPCARTHRAGAEHAAFSAETCRPQKEFRNAYLTSPRAISVCSLVTVVKTRAPYVVSTSTGRASCTISEPICVADSATSS